MCEDWNPNEIDTEDERSEADLRESFLTARAAAGTLAGAASDAEVAAAMIKSDCASSICALLATEHVDLVHRSLVMIEALLSSEVEGVAMHLLEGGVVPVMAVVAKAKNEQLANLARQCAKMLSAAISK